MVKVIEHSNFVEVKASKLAVVDFSAVWCGPCKMVSPVLEEISDEMTDVDFFNVDVDKNMDIAKEYRITNIPAIMVFKNGELADTQVGFVPKDQLAAFINKNK